MRIGIDIDGVLTDVERFTTDYLSKYCVLNNIPYEIGKSNYRVYKAFGITPAQEDAFWDEWLEPYSINEKARPFASEIIKKLKADGHEIYIITARWGTNEDTEYGARMRKIVKDWLAENDIVYDKLVFSKAAKEKKTQEMIEHKIDVMIEDSPINITELSSIVKIICYSCLYNMDIVDDNIIRCYSWYDIYKTIKNLAK